MSKWEDDFEKAREWRPSSALAIMEAGRKEGKQFTLNPVHEFLRTMTVVDKSRYNILSNRIRAVGNKQAMGLDYVLGGRGTDKKVYIVFRRFEDPGVYVKLPFLFEASLFLFINPPNNTKYACIKGDDPGLTWKQAASVGNRNRSEMYYRGHLVVPGDFEKIDIIAGGGGFYPRPSLPEFLYGLLK